MSNGPPPYAVRDHAQVQPPASPVSGPSAMPTTPAEFSETTSVCLEWRLTGLKAMYDSTKGEAKSKCIKSAVFGDADNLWEVLWYPNSGAAGGEFASLYLSCVPTAQEREESIGSKWTRKGLWWFRFEIRSTVPDDRVNKIVTLATKDASDHTFAVKTANWGWQQFAKRDSLFLHPTVQASDSFLIVCTIQAQSQPPAGYWLGLGLPPPSPYTAPNTAVGGRNVGSGGGLSAWSGGQGASGGVAGGTTAGGGVKRVVPKELISSVGALLDDPLYSDIEFIIPPSASNKRGMVIEPEVTTEPKRIFASKKLLVRCEYFEAMFNGGFREVEGVIEYNEDDDDMDMLSDSDVEDEAVEASSSSGLHLTTTISRQSDTLHNPQESTPPAVTSNEQETEPQDASQSDHEMETEESNAAVGGGEGHAETAMEEDVQAVPDEVQSKRDRGGVSTGTTPTPGGQLGMGPILGPRKTKVMIRDAAWSTWWAVLYWLYTDIIYFAPLTSSFPKASSSTPSHARSSSLAGFGTSPEAQSRREWIKQWMDERGISHSSPHPSGPLGPRPVSAKAVYRLADKLVLPALRLRAFQHICGQLSAQNIPAEVFSRFSSTYEDVRKVQVAFFLAHWQEIKKSETMTQIWQQIRLGKHVGFEEVWPLIVSQLEFRQS